MSAQRQAYRPPSGHPPTWPLGVYRKARRGRRTAVEQTHPTRRLGSVVMSIAAKITRSYLSRTGACLILSASVPGLVTPGGAHDWYPEECCRAKDCAPVESWAFAHAIQSGSLPQLSVTTKHGTAIVPRDLPRRESKDNRMHACMRGWGTVKQIVCIFLPPGT